MFVLKKHKSSLYAVLKLKNVCNILLVCSILIRYNDNSAIYVFISVSYYVILCEITGIPEDNSRAETE